MLIFDVLHNLKNGKNTHGGVFIFCVFHILHIVLHIDKILVQTFTCVRCNFDYRNKVIANVNFNVNILIINILRSGWGCGAVLG